MEGDSLFITVPDDANPSEGMTRELECLNGSTFRFWDTQSGWWTVTFIEGLGEPAPIRWLRNIRFVGQRRVDARPGAHGRRP